MSARQLFVEGKDDKYAIIHTIHKLRPDWPDHKEWFGRFEIVNESKDEASGDAKAIERFSLALKGTSADRIGLVLDADDQEGKRVANRWQSLSSHLSARWPSLAIPSSPPRDGWIQSIPNAPRFGIWLMPDNQNDGGLEAFLRPMVPTGALWDFASSCTDDAKKKYQAHYNLAHRNKAHLHTFLAWTDPPGHPYGLAIQSGDLDAHKNPVAEAFVAWFEGVFGS